VKKGKREKTMSKTFVAILAGSDSDLPVVQAGIDVLKMFNILFEVKVSSAHRTPVQMPGGIPVATVALGKTGAKNAGLAAKLAQERLDNIVSIQKKDQALQDKLKA